MGYLEESCKGSTGEELWMRLWRRSLSLARPVLSRLGPAFLDQTGIPGLIRSLLAGLNRTAWHILTALAWPDWSGWLHWLSLD
jgi:hypothetical protein